MSSKPARFFTKWLFVLCLTTLCSIVCLSAYGQTPTIIAGAVSGEISSCAGTASASPNIQQFTVSGSSLTGNITATAPTGFEVSLSAGSGYGNSVSLAQVSGTVSGMFVYVRSSASAPPGDISGNVTLSAAGATSQNVAIYGTINPIPNVSAVSDQTVNNGAATTAINFAGSANTFTWVNDTPGIGIPASGKGNITSFKAVNTGNSPVVASITATPVNAAYAYIANSNEGNVKVVNTITNKVITTISAGSAPYGVAVSPDGSLVYVSNTDSYTVSVISTATNAVITTINAGLIPEGIVVSPDGSRVYVVDKSNGVVSVISTATNTVISTLTAAAEGATGIAVSPDGTLLYVSNVLTGNVVVINTVTKALVATVIVGSSPDDLIVSPDGSKVYVTNAGSNTVSVIGTATNTVTATINVGTAPWGIAMSPDGSKVYVANTGSNNISVIGTATNTVLATVATGTFPIGVSINEDGSLVFVTNQNSNSVSEISTVNNTVIATVPVGVQPSAVGNFLTAGAVCSGAPVKFTITVNPSPPAITSTTASGKILACQGSPSSSPYMQQFAVSGTGLIGNIVATAPAGFEVSLSNAGGYGHSVSLSPSSLGMINSIPVYVRSAASASVGDIQGNLVLTSTNATSQNVLVTGAVIGLTMASPVTNQQIINGAATAAINFTGTANTFNWVNDTPGIGLPASGTGNIPSFTAVNTGSVPVTATITVTPTSPAFAYIANEGGGLSVINTATNKVAATIAVGGNPNSVAVSPDGTRVYVANVSSNSISVINSATNTVIATVPVGIGPTYVTVSPDGSRVYSVNLSDADVSVINALTNQVINTFQVQEYPIAAAISPDGTTAYVTNQDSNTLSVISTATDMIVDTVPMSNHPYGVAVSPDGSHVYVTNAGVDSVTVISTSTNTIVNKITVGTYPGGICISPDGSRIYVANQGDHSVSVINASTNAVTTLQIPGAANTQGISITSDGQFVYATNVGSGTVSVINTANNKITATIPVGINPVSLGNFVSPGACDGTPIKFTITINPGNASTAIITATVVTGSISACAGTAAASPNIQQFAVKGSGLSANITATASTFFELSLAPDSGYKSSIILNQTAGAVDSTLIYVRSAASASPGYLSGNVVLTSTGATSQNIGVSATVNPLPVINGVPDQIVASGAATIPINFVGTGTSTFNWVNDTPGIGLPESGTGNIHSFTPVNTGTSPVTATITVTGNSATGCSSTPVTFTITVNPVLPPTNFKLMITSATCDGVSDGSVSVTAADALNYTATITGNGINTPYPFTNSVTINNLAAGTYSVCITIAGQSSFQQCYDAVITQPQDLSAYATINSSNNTVTLALSGSTNYNIQLNGELYTTSNNSISLPLKTGNNDLKVSTDKPCQGTFEKLINTSGIISPYPVPFQNTLNLNLGNTNINNVSVKIYNIQNQSLVYSNKYANQSGVLQLDLSSLNMGVYALYLTLDNVEKIFKISK